MLAVRNTINSIRRSDLECSAEELVCEIRPSLKRKLLIVVFYRPPDSNLDYLKELKKSFRLANQARFDQLVVCGDFNLPHIDWEFGTATTGDSIHNYFTKLVRDTYLWQMIDFPTRNNNMLDLILTNIPEKISDIHGFDDILNTDHKLVSFVLDFNIPKEPKTKRFVYNFKKANWDALKEVLTNTPWDMSFVPGDIEASLSNWCDLFVSVVNDHVPKRRVRNVHDHPWLDLELMKLIKKKNKQRITERKTKTPDDLQKFKDLRRETKKLMKRKKKDYANKLRDSLSENPKRFWSLVKASTTQRSSPSILHDGHKIITDKECRANLLNSFFHSVFSEVTSDSPADAAQPLTNQRLSNIRLSESEVTAALENLDPAKACGPDKIPGRLLKATAKEIAPSLCQLFNMSLELGSLPGNWKMANITPVFKQDDPSLVQNYRPISLLCTVSKVLERCVFNHCYPHLIQFIYHLQQGFLKRRSTKTQLLGVYHDILASLAC